MLVDPINFQHSLARYVAGRAGLVYQPATPGPRSLWINKVIEADALDPYTLIRQQLGPSQYGTESVSRMSIKVRTVGRDATETMRQAQSVFEALKVPDGSTPLRFTQIDARTVEGQADGKWLISSLDFNYTPGFNGTDVNQKSIVEFAATINYRKAAR